MQRGTDLPVDRVGHRNVQNGAAQVNDGVELLPHLPVIMFTGDVRLDIVMGAFLL